MSETYSQDTSSDTTEAPESVSFNFTRLPPELQLQVAEQLGYRDLKRLRAVSKSMKELVASNTATLNASLFRQSTVDYDALDLCLSDGERPTYGDLLKLHPVLSAGWCVPMYSDEGGWADPELEVTDFTLEEPFMLRHLRDFPKTVKENCSAPPVSHIHLCWNAGGKWRRGDEDQSMPGQWSFDCYEADECISSKNGAPVTVGSLLRALSKSVFHRFQQAESPPPEFFRFNGWYCVVPHPEQPEVINFCGPRLTEDCR